MAYLISNHDPYHIHSICGLLTLLHFIYRWFLLLTTGTSWYPSETLISKTSLMLIHIITPIASLQLPLPIHRNESMPMIWPEFRLHSVIFSTRHTFSTIVSFILPFHYAIFVQICISHISMICASHVSAKFGNPDYRTTNAMPYPSHAASDDIATVKRVYIYSQMFASSMSICGNADFAFMPLLAIQLAPLMMTLVRKGLAKSDTYHFVYSWALAMPALGTVSHIIQTNSTIMPAFVLGCAISAHKMRISYHIDKHIVWVISPVIGWAFVIIYHEILWHTVILNLEIFAFIRILIDRSSWVAMTWFIMRIYKCNISLLQRSSP